jgi:hypothetical protein
MRYLRANPAEAQRFMGSLLENGGEVPHQLGPVPIMVHFDPQLEWPHVAIRARGYQDRDEYFTLVFEFDSDAEHLRVMVYGDPYDPEGAPTHYLNLTPYDPRIPGRPVEPTSHVWDAIGGEA